MAVFLFTTRAGLSAFEDEFGTIPKLIWVGADVLTAKEIETYRQRGIKVTNFDHEIALNSDDAILDALQTISEHYPGKSILVEH